MLLFVFTLFIGNYVFASNCPTFSCSGFITASCNNNPGCNKVTLDETINKYGSQTAITFCQIHCNINDSCRQLAKNCLMSINNLCTINIDNYKNRCM